MILLSRPYGKAALWGGAVAAALATTLFPAIDLTAAGWFYDPVTHFFPVRDAAWAEWIRHGLPHYIFALLGLAVLLWAWGRVRRRWILGMSDAAAAFLVLSLALGPGLAVNVILKDHWGRPRPATVTQFGGPFDYRPPVVPGGPCPNNCSFPSGHASLGFWMVAPALLVPSRVRRGAVASALGFGAIIGLVRMAQGGHFLSDVIYAGLITVGIITVLYSLLIARRAEPSPKNHPPVGE